MLGHLESVLDIFSQTRRPDDLTCFAFFSSMSHKQYHKNPTRLPEIRSSVESQFNPTALPPLWQPEISATACLCASYLPRAAGSEEPQRAISRDCWPRRAGWSDAPVLGAGSPRTTGTQSSQAETVWLCGKDEWALGRLMKMFAYKLLKWVSFKPSLSPVIILAVTLGKPINPCLFS